LVPWNLLHPDCLADQGSLAVLEDQADLAVLVVLEEEDKGDNMTAVVVDNNHNHHTEDKTFIHRHYILIM